MQIKKTWFLGTVLVLILLSALVLRWRAAHHSYISQWDEAYHALVAKNLVRHPLTPLLYDNPLRVHDFKDWSESPVWLHKPPVPLWLMAIALWIGGTEEFVFRLPSVILGVGTALLLFLLARTMFPGEGTFAGLIAGLFFAVNPLMIRLTSGTIPTDHVDISLVFFVALALYLVSMAYHRSTLFLWMVAGLVMGIAFLCKAWPAMIAFLAATPLLFKKDETILSGLTRGGVILGGFLVIAAPWNLYCFRRWPTEYSWEMSYNFLKHLLTVVEGHEQPFWYYLSLIFSHFGGVGAVTYVIVLGSLLWAIRHYYRSRDRRFLVLMIWALTPYLIFSLTRTKMYSYMAPAVPGVLLLVGIVTARIVRNTTRRNAMICGLVPVLYLTPLVIQRIQAKYDIPVWNNVYDYASFRETFRSISHETGRKVVFNVADRKQPQAMYYGNCTAYADLPPVGELVRTANEGWQVYVVIPDAAQGTSAWMQQVAQQGGLGKIRMLPIKTGPQKPDKDPYEN